MGLGDAILQAVLAYARARLEELVDEVLADAAAFAHALGVDAFVDAGGQVAAELASTRTEIAALGTSVSSDDLKGAATHLGAAVQHADAAAAIVGGRSLIDLLKDEIGWTNVTPQGLAAQLGVPAQVPGLTLTDGVLTYRIEVPGRTLLPAPLTLSFEKAVLSASLRIDGGSPAFAVAFATTGMEAGVVGLPGGGDGSVTSALTIGVNTDEGLTLQGSVAPRVVLPAAPKVGPLDVRELVMELPSTRPSTIDLGSTVTVDLGGVVTGTVDGAGLHVGIDPGAVADGHNPLSVAVKAPTGLGLAIDSGLVKGGGYLGERSGGYGGALELRLGPVEVQAVGLLTLEPSFALVVVMSVRFTPAIDLSFGFTLNAVGGVIGINHRVDGPALRAGIAGGALDHVLFPADPVAAAPAILSTLETVFPTDTGSVLVGPMVEIGWGRPISFLVAQLGVIVSLPDPLVVIVGRARIAIPAPELPIVDFNATLYGEISEDHLLILVSLRNSRIAGFPVSGDVGLLLQWAGDADVAISAGGFHPAYQPPPGLEGMHRIEVDLSPPAILQLRATAYVAVTTNSLQLGARVDLSADLAVASVSGFLQFDALVLFSPRFMFLIDLAIGLTVRALGTTLCGIHVNLHLEGPAPWRAEGHATISILWWDVSIDLGPYTWGNDDNPPPALADPRQLVFDALNRNPTGWQALLPPDADRAVTLLPVQADGTDAVVHPLGLFDVRQHAVPLETRLVRVGADQVPDDRQRVWFGMPTAGGVDAGAISAVTDRFAPGNYLDLTDDERLSRPAFEDMPAGARIRPPGEVAEHAASRQAELRYETFVADDPSGGRIRALLVDTIVSWSAGTMLAAGAAGRSTLRARKRYAVEPDPIVLAGSGESLLTSPMTGSPSGEATTFTLAAEKLSPELQIVRLGV